MTGAGHRPRVLVLARNYPNTALPSLGIWTRRLVFASRGVADPVVVAPVQYAPPGLAVAYYAKFRRIPERRCDDGLDVYHPRVPAGPGTLLHSYDAQLGYPFVRRLTDRLHRRQPFDLIHAHLIYPDGVMAARLGRRYGIPVVTTELAHWLPWLERYPRVRRQVLTALPGINRVLAVSEGTRAVIHRVAGDGARTEVFPNVVDEETFVAPSPADAWDPNQILFVGAIRRVKGFDVLVRALARLAPRRPELRLLVVGSAFLRGWQRDEAEVRTLVGELGLSARVHFAGGAPPPEVAAAMRRSALLVVPSRRETFSVVAAEALASGTPVVATRCGGPEDFVTEETGRIVPVEDAAALADAIDSVLVARPSFDRRRLHEHAVSRFGSAATVRRFETLYREVLAEGRAPARRG